MKKELERLRSVELAYQETVKYRERADKLVGSGYLGWHWIEALCDFAEKAAANAGEARPLTLDQRAQAAIVEGWKATPEGTEVVVTKDDGSTVRTKTRSAPWLLGGHTAVIMVEGISGAYSLERVRHA